MNAADIRWLYGKPSNRKLLLEQLAPKIPKFAQGGVMPRNAGVLCIPEQAMGGSDLTELLDKLRQNLTVPLPLTPLVVVGDSDAVHRTIVKARAEHGNDIAWPPLGTPSPAAHRWEGNGYECTRCWASMHCPHCSDSCGGQGHGMTDDDGFFLHCQEPERAARKRAQWTTP